MPKKHHHTYKTSSSNTYVHPSFRSASAGSPSNVDSSANAKSVNERLQQLRLEQTPHASRERKSQLASLATQRTVPPLQRQLLGLPETAPPPPKAGGARRRGRGPPGPAAPQSWLDGRAGEVPDAQRGLLDSMHSPRSARRPGAEDRVEALARVESKEFSTLSMVREWESRGRTNTLVQQCLKTLARNWSFIAVYEQHFLATLAADVKSALISYLAVYGPPQGIRLHDLKLLFKTTEQVPDGTGSEGFARLDLTGLISPSLTIAELEKFFTMEVASTDASKEISASGDPEPVLDSWEDEMNAPQLPRSVRAPRFPSLTHLSLAKPSAPSWPALLSLSMHLGTLTHLSLANWPMPTFTPNAKTAHVVCGMGPEVSLGGTSYYAAMDDDWQEAASILRRLSANTYCLRELDLEGCTEWARALVWGVGREAGAAADRTAVGIARSSSVNEEWDSSAAASGASPSCTVGPDWTGAWRQVSRLNLSQGWLPNKESIQGLPSRLICMQLLAYLRTVEDEFANGQVSPGSDEGGGSSRVEQLRHPDGDRGMREGIDVARKWVDREAESRRVESTIRELRTRAGQGFCRVEHGWSPVTVNMGKKAHAEG